MVNASCIRVKMAMNIVSGLYREYVKGAPGQEPYQLHRYGIIFELQCIKTCNVVYVPIDDSDELGHPSGLIIVMAYFH